MGNVDELSTRLARCLLFSGGCLESQRGREITRNEETVTFVPRQRAT